MRMWELREEHKEHDAESAYKEGFEEGYREALETFRGKKDESFKEEIRKKYL